jgi:hypothetical protein
MSRSLHQLMAIKTLVKYAHSRDVTITLLTDALDETQRKRQLGHLFREMTEQGTANVAIIAVRF